MDRPRDDNSTRAETALKSVDHSGVDQQAIEPARLGAVGAAVEQAVAAPEYLFLLEEGCVERKARRLLHDQRQVRRIERIQRGAEVGGHAARAQQRTMPVVGFLNGGSAPQNEDRVRSFRQGPGRDGIC